MYCKFFLLTITLNQLILVTTQTDNETLAREMELKHCVAGCHDDREALTTANIVSPAQESVIKDAHRLLIIGGTWVETFGKKSFEIVDLQNSSPNHVVNATLKINRIGHMSGVLSDGKVVIAGGVKRVREIKSREFFDPSTNKVTQGPDMNEKRKEAGGAILSDAFYVCGGYGDYRKHSSCERLVRCTMADQHKICQYDSREQQVVYSLNFILSGWEFIAPMGVNRSELQMVALGNNVYAIGGDDSQCGCVVEKYFPMNNTWTRVKEMQRGRLRFSATVLDGKIYVCGGKSFAYQSLPLNECEMYDPINDQWTNIAPMKKQRWCLAMTPVGGLIYAAGDCWHADHKVIVEKYDPVKNDWTVIDDYELIHPRSRFTMHPI